MRNFYDHNILLAWLFFLDLLRRFPPPDWESDHYIFHGIGLAKSKIYYSQ